MLFRSSEVKPICIQLDKQIIDANQSRAALIGVPRECTTQPVSWRYWFLACEHNFGHFFPGSTLIWPIMSQYIVTLEFRCQGDKNICPNCRQFQQPTPFSRLQLKLASGNSPWVISFDLEYFFYYRYVNGNHFYYFAAYFNMTVVLILSLFLALMVTKNKLSGEKLTYAPSCTKNTSWRQLYMLLRDEKRWHILISLPKMLIYSTTLCKRFNQNHWFRARLQISIGLLFFFFKTFTIV